MKYPQNQDTGGLWELEGIWLDRVHEGCSEVSSKILFLDFKFCLFFSLTVLVFEFKVIQLLGRNSTTPPALFALVVFQIGSHTFRVG
jgi:hypothetical protein